MDKSKGYNMGAAHMQPILANFRECFVIEVKMLQKIVPTYGMLPNVLNPQEAANERF